MYRLMGIRRPGGNSCLQMRGALAVIAFIWIQTFICASPNIVYADVYSPAPGVLICNNRHADVLDHVAPYSIAIQVLNCHIPLAITWASYVAIIFMMRASIPKVILKLLISSHRQKHNIKSTNRQLKTQYQ